MAAAGGSGSGGGGGTDISMVLPYDDVTWERDGRGDKVIIGRGAFGIVYAGVLHGQPVAIKAEVLEVGDEEAWLTAVRLQKSATCPHIVAVHGIVVDRFGGKVTHLSVMERLAGTMSELLLMPGGAHHGADMALRLQLLADVAGGLAYLHSREIIHTDVNPDNVLLTAVTPRSPHPAAKLADFGSSMLHVGSETRNTLLGERGTLLYMDPRLFDPAISITTASDVYSFGMMAWQVLSGLQPYDVEMKATLPTATVPQKVEALRRYVLGGGRPPVAALVKCGVPTAVVALVQVCWAPEQAARPAMADVHRALEMAAAPLVFEWDDKVELRGHSTAVASLALLPGGRLASGDRRGEVRFWDVTRGGKALAAVLGGLGKKSVVHTLAVLPDGRLAAGVWDESKTVGAIVVWDTSVVPPARRATINCGSDVWVLAVLRDGRLAAGCFDGGVRLVEVGASVGAVTATLDGHTKVVRALAVLPDGTLASGSWDETVRLWDVGTRTCIATLAGHPGGGNVLAVLANGRLASGSNVSGLWLWDVATRSCVGTLGVGPMVTLAALPDGRLLSASDDNAIRVWSARTIAAAAGADAAGAAAAKPVAELEGHSGGVHALELLPGGRLASASWDGKVRLWRLPP